jgi:hypothetical protein
MTTEPGLAHVFVRSERMVGRRIADEYILVPIVGRGAEVDAIFSLNRVAAFIWEHLDGTASGDAILDSLLQQFDVPRPEAEAHYRGFIAQLLSIRAVRPHTE